MIEENLKIFQKLFKNLQGAYQCQAVDQEGAFIDEIIIDADGVLRSEARTDEKIKYFMYYSPGNFPCLTCVNEENKQEKYYTNAGKTFGIREERPSGSITAFHINDQGKRISRHYTRINL